MNMSNEILTEDIEDIHARHYAVDGPYKRIIDGHFGHKSTLKAEGMLPYIHARLFKTVDFRIPKVEYLHQFTSSGTSGVASTIFFTREDAIRQQKMLSRIMSEYMGVERKGAYIDISTSDNEEKNARTAAGKGFSLLAKKRFRMRYNQENTVEEIKKILISSERVILFGFTYEIFLLFNRIREEGCIVRNAEKLYVIHGGGWKKLRSSSISDEDLDKLIKTQAPGSTNLNYYGMVEQLGIVYPRCVDGYHHCPEGTDVLIVNKYGNYVEDGSTGLIQSNTYIKNSYPTHSVLTEDLGYLVTESSCGRDSKRFKVLGRVALSEVRGCSDAH